jgi:hypothetical protein
MRKTSVCWIGCLPIFWSVLAIGRCALALLAAPSAGAAQGWLAPTDVSALGENPQGLQLAGDVRGDAVALWENQFGFSWRTLKVAVRRAGGAWRGSLSLVQASTGLFAQPAVAIAPQGAVIAAVWQESASPYQDSTSVIRAVAGPADTDGIARRRPARLSTIGLEGRSPQVAVDRLGDAVAVWEENNREVGYVVRAAVKPTGRRAWRAPVTISGNVQGRAGG